MRREKEIAETRFEVAQVETERYQQRMQHLEKELKEVQDSLIAERDKLQVRIYKIMNHTISYNDDRRFMNNLLYRVYVVFTDDCKGHGSAGGEAEKAGEL